MFKSFRQRIIIINLIIIIVFISLLTSLYYLQESESLIEYTKSNSLSANEFYATRIGNSISHHINLLKYIANSPSVKSGSKQLVVDEMIYMHSTEDSLFIDVFYSGTDRHYTSVLGTTGVINERDYFHELEHAKDGHIISEPLYEQYAHMPSVLVVVPINDENGKAKALLGGLINLNALAGDFENIKHSGDSYGWLIDEDGLVLGHPNPIYPMKIMIQDADEAGYPGLSDIGKTMITTDSGFGEYHDTLSDEAKIVTYAVVPYTSGWKLAITTLKKDIFAPLETLYNNVLNFAVATILLYMIAIILLSKNMVKPIEDLTAAVEASERMDFTQINLPKRQDELGKLVSAYNKMTESLKDYTTNLETIVEDRTMELMKLNKQLDHHNKRLTALNDQLYDMATTDGLTGLLNHTQIIEEVKINIENVDSKISPYFSLMFLDLDNFKYCNDSFGHEVGDKVLQLFSQQLRKHFRNTDIIGRYGGDEFIIVLMNTSEKDAKFATHNFRNAIKEQNGYTSQLQSWCQGTSVSIPKEKRIDVSIGVSTYTYGCDKSTVSLIKEADQNMYRMKQIKKTRGSL